jgi:hypothetical protein
VVQLHRLDEREHAARSDRVAGAGIERDDGALQMSCDGHECAWIVHAAILAGDARQS